MERDVSIKDKQLQNVQDDLIKRYPKYIVKGLLNSDARTELARIVAKEHGRVVKGDEELIQKIVSETVGTGIIEEIIKDETITDIGFNGSDLIIESNDKKQKYQGEQRINDDYIVRVVTKFANAVGKDFSPKHPRLNTVFENMRISAVNRVNSPYGTTMSLRITRPKLALNETNFHRFAPDFILDFIKSIMKVKGNVVISGETGTGKTELQKLMISYIPFSQKIIMIEDVPESHVKEMFPDKDIISWITSEEFTITKAIKEGLRNNPRWMMVSETRGEEAYEMIQAVLSGHYITTSLHAVSARAIPKRLVNMAKIGYNIDEEMLDTDIRTYFDFGFHLKRTYHEGKMIRYLSEIVAFNPEGDETIFKQRFINGQFEFDTGKLPKYFIDKLEEEQVPCDFPDNYKSSSLLREVNYISENE